MLFQKINHKEKENMVQNIELMNRKLNTIPVKDLRELAGIFGISKKGSHGEIAVRLIDQDADQVDAFIKRKYQEKVMVRRTMLVSDDELIAQLEKVESIEWRAVQEQLDGKIQREYVRRYATSNNLFNNIDNRLRGETINYAVAMWYNYWSTVLIKDQIYQHPNVVPALKRDRRIALFFDDHSFDLKVTYLPRDYDLNDAINAPKTLARWLYEHQGGQRFGSENRLYVVVADANDITQSWKIKRDIALVSDSINRFLNAETVSASDTVPFVYKEWAYVPTCKILLITK